MRPLPPPDAGGGSSQAHGVLAGLFFNPSLVSALLGCLIAQVSGCECVPLAVVSA